MNNSVIYWKELKDYKRIIELIIKGMLLWFRIIDFAYDFIL